MEISKLIHFHKILKDSMKRQVYVSLISYKRNSLKHIVEKIEKVVETWNYRCFVFVDQYQFEVTEEKK